MTAQPGTLRNVRLISFVVFVCLFLFQVLGVLLSARLGRQDSMDFRHMYVAGYILRTGQGAQLYDYSLQERLQNELVRPERPLPFDHLAYEALLFAPFSYLGYFKAYYLFQAFNLLLLICAQQLFRPRLVSLESTGKLVPEAIFYCFCPVFVAMIQGQDSILLLLLAVLASRALDEGHEARAGFLYSLGFFKFQFVLPVALLFLLWRKWKFVSGAAAGAMAVCGASLAITGLAGARAYLAMLLQMNSAMGHPSEQPKFGNSTAFMPNLTGLFQAIGGAHLPAAALRAAILAGTALVLWYAIRLRPSFPVALVVATLVSYHGFIHDSSLLALPLGVFLGHAVSAGNWRSAGAGLVVYVAPTFLSVSGRYFLFTILLLGFLYLWRREFERPPSSIPLEANYNPAKS